VTRAEFLALTLNAAGVDVSGEAPVFDYADVGEDYPLAGYIAYATRNGIVSGQNGYFRPDDIISRGEAAKILINATDVTLSAAIDTFDDVTTSDTLAVYIQTAFDNCILHGRYTQNGVSTLPNGERLFEPFDGITLGETAKVLYNIAAK
jgi:hypothetical protein